MKYTKILKVLLYLLFVYIGFAKVNAFQKGFIGKVYSEADQGGEETEAPLPSSTSKPPASPSPKPPASPSPTPPISPSPIPTQSLVCTDLIRNPGDDLDIGDAVIFTCSHQLNNVTFHHYDYRFNIDGGDWQNPSGWQGLTGNTPAYTIAQAGTYTVQCRVCSTTGSDHCTDWGQAGGWTP